MERKRGDEMKGGNGVKGKSHLWGKRKAQEKENKE